MPCGARGQSPWGIREAVSICAEAEVDVVEMASPVRYNDVLVLSVAESAKRFRSVNPDLVRQFVVLRRLLGQCDPLVPCHL
jgi:hypothetical protein